MASQDVEAGRAYVTLYLRRVGFDQQVEQVRRDTTEMEQTATDAPSTAQDADQPQRRQPQQPYTEAGISMPAETAQAVAKGAAGWLGGTLAANLARVLPLLRSLPTVAAGATAGVSAMGAATASAATTTTALGAAATGAATATAAQATATQGAAIVTAQLVTASVAAVPAVAATGTAAAGASVGLAAMATAALPIVIPLAALAAAAYTVYAAIFKWDELSLPVRALLLVLSPLVLAVRAVVLAVKAMGLAISVVTAPFRLAAATVGMFYRAAVAIPGAIAAIPGLLQRVGVAALDMGKKVAAAAGQMAASVGRAAVATGAALAKLPGQLAGYASGAVNAVSGALQGLGMTIGKAGAVAAGLSTAIVGPLTMAAQQFGAYGQKIREVQNEYQKFALTAEETAVIMRVSEQTGESIQKLAEQMREGTRDFSRWRAEVQASGMSMSGPGLGAALALSRAYYSLRESLSGLRMALGEAVGPAITETTQVITGAVRAVTRWVADNKPLIAQIFRVASAVGIAATAITTIGGAIAGAGALLSPFTAALAAIAAGLAIVEVRTGAGRSIWAAYADSVKRAYATVVQYLGQMAAFASKVVGGVKDALAAGDLAGAVNVLWSGAKVAWIAGLTELDTLTRGAFGGILQNLAAGRWSAAGEAVMAALQVAWQNGIIAISGMWGTIVDAADTAWLGLQTGFDGMLGSLEKGMYGLFEKMKQWGVSFLMWMSNSVLMPLAKTMGDIAGTPAFTAAPKITGMAQSLKGTIKDDTQIEADKTTIDQKTAIRQADRENEFLDRQADRAAAGAERRIAAEREIARLKQRQAELAREGTNATQDQQSANQRQLDQAIAAAKAAREAADAGRLKEEDFAVSTKTESLTRFSGAALELSVGRQSNDPQKRIAKLAEDQLGKLSRIAEVLDDNLAEIMRLQGLGGFA